MERGKTFHCTTEPSLRAVVIGIEQVKSSVLGTRKRAYKCRGSDSM